MSTCTGRSSPGQQPYATVEVPIATSKQLLDYVAAGITAGVLSTPADETWDTDEATTRTNFVAKFVGVNAQLKPDTVTARIPGNSQDNIIVVENEGEFDVVVESATYSFGQRLGPSKDTGNALKNTSFKGVSTDAQSCFRVCKTYTSATTLVRARVMSTLMPASK